ERIDLLEEEVGSVHELIDAFFRFLRAEDESTTVVDLDEVLADLLPLVRAYCRVARVEVVYEPAGGALVRIGLASLQQIVLNLIVNAVDAMRPAGGRISIGTTDPGGEVHLRIGDTGPGFSADAPLIIGDAALGSRPDRAGL